MRLGFVICAAQQSDRGMRINTPDSVGEPFNRRVETEFAYEHRVQIVLSSGKNYPKNGHSVCKNAFAAKTENARPRPSTRRTC
jgi:hypothetical protein